jgi:hypothetical protein
MHTYLSSRNGLNELPIKLKDRPTENPFQLWFHEYTSSATLSTAVSGLEPVGFGSKG